jgi:hypothetical protein
MIPAESKLIAELAQFQLDNAKNQLASIKCLAQLFEVGLKIWNVRQQAAAPGNLDSPEIRSMIEAAEGEFAAHSKKSLSMLLDCVARQESDHDHFELFLGQLKTTLGH